MRMSVAWDRRGRTAGLCEEKEVVSTKDAGESRSNGDAVESALHTRWGAEGSMDAHTGGVVRDATAADSKTGACGEA